MERCCRLLMFTSSLPHGFMRVYAENMRTIKCKRKNKKKTKKIREMKEWQHATSCFFVSLQLNEVFPWKIKPGWASHVPQELLTFSWKFKNLPVFKCVSIWWTFSLNFHYLSLILGTILSVNSWPFSENFLNKKQLWPFLVADVCVTIIFHKT